MNGISCVGDECVQMGKDIAEGIWLWKMENAIYVLIGLAAAFVLVSAEYTDGGWRFLEEAKRIEDRAFAMRSDLKSPRCRIVHEKNCWANAEAKEDENGDQL